MSTALHTTQRGSSLPVNHSGVSVGAQIIFQRPGAPQCPHSEARYPPPSFLCRRRDEREDISCWLGLMWIGGIVESAVTPDAGCQDGETRMKVFE